MTSQVCFDKMECENHQESDRESVLSVDLSCCSSSFEEGEDSSGPDRGASAAGRTKILPYQFEPYCTSSDSGSGSDPESTDGEDSAVDRLHNTDW